MNSESINFPSREWHIKCVTLYGNLDFSNSLLAGWCTHSCTDKYLPWSRATLDRLAMNMFDRVVQMVVCVCVCICAEDEGVRGMCQVISGHQCAFQKPPLQFSEKWGKRKRRAWSDWLLSSGIVKVCLLSCNNNILVTLMNKIAHTAMHEDE